VTIFEKGTHEDMALAVSNQTSIKERSRKLHVSYLAKNPVGISWHNFRHILPQSIQTSAAYNPRSLTRKQPCLSQARSLKRLHKQNKALNKSPGTKARGGGYSPILPIRGRTVGQGMVFGLSVLNRIQNFNQVCP